MRLTLKQIREIREHLETAREASTLEKANLYPFDKDSVAKMDELRERVKLHHQSWITRPIDDVLKILSIAPR